MSVPSDIVFNTTTILIRQLINLLYIDVSSTSIRNGIHASPNYPYVTLGHISNLLGNWGIESLAINASIDVIEQCQLPAICMISGLETDGNDLVIITGITATNVYSYSASLGYRKHPLEEFRHKLEGVTLLLLEPKPGAGEPEFLAMMTTEAAVRLELSKKVVRKTNVISSDECDVIVQNYRRHVDTQPSSPGTDLPTPGLMTLPDNVVPNSIIPRLAEILGVDKDQISAPGVLSIRRKDRPAVSLNAHEVMPFDSLLLIHLNRDFETGPTTFPELDLTFEAEKGSGIMVPLWENGIKTSYSFFNETPPRFGTKYVMLFSFGNRIRR